jgi:hypothetical protein
MICTIVIDKALDANSTNCTCIARHICTAVQAAAAMLQILDALHQSLAIRMYAQFQTWRYSHAFSAHAAI